MSNEWKSVASHIYPSFHKVLKTLGELMILTKDFSKFKPTVVENNLSDFVLLSPHRGDTIHKYVIRELNYNRALLNGQVIIAVVARLLPQ